MMLSNDHPNSGVCKGCKPEEGYSHLNTGLLLIRSTPTGMEMLRNWMGATFPAWGDPSKVSLPTRSRLHWPWEQLALNHKNMSVYKAYRCARRPTSASWFLTHISLHHGASARVAGMR